MAAAGDLLTRRLTKLFGACLASLLTAQSTNFYGRGFFIFWLIVDLPRRDPHDVDGVADHVGGALLAFAASSSLSDSIGSKSANS